MELKTPPAVKLAGLMVDIVTLISELNQMVAARATECPALTAPERAAWIRDFKEIEQTLCSKLVEVKYFRSLGDSFIKVSKPKDGRAMYLEIVTVYEGTVALDYAPEFEMQVHPLTGWFPAFRSCEPCSATEYQAAVDLALEKGAVVV